MAAPLLTTDLDALVPQVAWQNLVHAALQAPSYRILVSGGLIFTIYLVSRFALALWALEQGQRPQWLRPLVVLALYMVVLSHYETLVIGTLRVVTHLGSTDAGMMDIDAMFRARNQALAGAMLQDRPPTGWTLLTPDGLSLVLLQVTAQLLQTVAHAVCIALRCLQIILLAVLVQAGPILIGFSLLGGPVGTLGIGWWMALFEVAAWSWVQDIALKVFLLLATALPEHLGLIHEMTLSLVFITALGAVPVISSMLIRGQSAAGIGHTLGTSAAAWTMARTHGLARSTSPFMGRAARQAFQGVRAASQRGGQK